MHKKTGINDLLYLNRLMAENARRREAAQEQAIRGIAHNPSRQNSDGSVDDAKESIPICGAVMQKNNPISVHALTGIVH
jgi:hypothetical protein